MLPEKEASKLLEKYADNLSRSSDPEKFLRWARHFLSHTAGLDKSSIVEYIVSLQDGYKPGTVNFAFRIIRRLFMVNRLEWEYRQGEAPLIKQRDEYRPRLSKALIEVMIGKATAQELRVDQAAFLALSTVYGIRRIEIMSLQPEDINFRKGSIFVATAKSGRERYHMVPEEIIPYLRAHDFSQRYGASTMNKHFQRILASSGGRHLIKQKLGWHSIRRGLYEDLVLNGVDVMAAAKFLRWKSRTGDTAMPARYYGNVEVGLETHDPVLEEAKKDSEVFEKHPYLPFWRNDA